MEERKLIETLTVFDLAQGSITLSNAMTPEMPLIYVNKSFEIVSGYKRDEIIGKNCRFLQGSLRDQDGVRTIRDTITKKTGCLVELINFRKDGKRFINRLSLRPIYNKIGHLKYFIGIQNDVTMLKELEDKIAQHVAAQTD